MSSQPCPRCGNSVQSSAQSCQRCGYSFGTSKRPTEPFAISAGVTCPKCGRVNRTDAKFCVYCKSSLNPAVPIASSPHTELPSVSPMPSYSSSPIGTVKERTRIPPRLVMLTVLGAIALIGLIVGVITSLNPNNRGFVSPGGQQETPNSGLTPSGDSNYQTLVDRQFGYQITVPRKWHVAALNASRQGAAEWPLWSVLISNVEMTSWQSRPENAVFAIGVYRQPITNEEELLAQVTEMVIAQPGDVLRLEQGATIEYYTARKLLNSFGRLSLGRWIWDGKYLLSVIVSIYDQNKVEIDLLEQAVDSVRLLAR